MRIIEQDGRTVEEAIEAALSRLGLTRDEVEIEVLSEGREGFFGLMGGRRARVKVKPAPKESERERDDGRAAQDEDAEEAEADESRNVSPAADDDRGDDEVAEHEDIDGRSEDDFDDDEDVEDDEGEEEDYDEDDDFDDDEDEDYDEDDDFDDDEDEDYDEDDDFDEDDDEDYDEDDDFDEDEDEDEDYDEDDDFDEDDGDEEEEDDEEEVPLSEDPERADAHRSLERILDGMLLDVEVASKRRSGEIYLMVSGDDAGDVIGRKGKTLDALQHVMNRIVNSDDPSERTRIHVDADGYRERRKKGLVDMAKKLAAKVEKSGRPSYVMPLNPHDRRIVHVALKDNEKVETYSRGNGFMRRIVVVPAGKGDSGGGRRGGGSRRRGGRSRGGRK